LSGGVDPADAQEGFGALAAANEAIAVDSHSARAWLALSYAQQAQFKLDEATESVRKATELAPDSSLAQARLAELLMSSGRIRDAEKAAKRAVEIAPQEARAHMVLGFVYLAKIDTKRARESFTTAISLNSTEPLSRLGFGLAEIREGRLKVGREQLEIAAALDPQNSLLRSYLGKAYYEENTKARDQLAATQFELAKSLDPNDPTPWFYDAILQHANNSPIGALQSLDEAIALNNNKSVYRSRLLLDQDLAARNANLARAYTTVGFDNLALITAYRSVALDPLQYSAHRFLAEYYSTFPRHQVARDSELLQSQLLQPLLSCPVQPDLASETQTILKTFTLSPGNADHTALLETGRKFEVSATGLTASHNTSEATIVACGSRDDTAMSAGHFYFETEGYRPNNQQQKEISNLFLKGRVNTSTSLLADIRKLSSEAGTIQHFFFDNEQFLNSEITEEDISIDAPRIGIKHEISPRSTALATYSYQELVANLNLVGRGHQLLEETTHVGEAQLLHKGTILSTIAGFGVLRLRAFTAPAVLPTTDTLTTDNANAYVYTAYTPFTDLLINLGVSADTFEDIDTQRSQISPKLGITWQSTPTTTLRIAAARGQSRPLVSSQTLEPTQVAGFNQFYDDIIGAQTWLYGIGLLVKTSALEAFTLNALKRDVSQIHRIGVPRETSLTEHLVTLRFNRAPNRRFAFSVGYDYTQIDGDIDGFNPLQLSKSETHMIPIEWRVFYGDVFLSTAATSVWQRGRFCDFSVPPPTPSSFCAISFGEDSFTIVDITGGISFPQRKGRLTVGLLNALNEKFQYQAIDPKQSTIARELTVFGKLDLHF
jgi:Tfp pilus assembly protein PilF